MLETLYSALLVLSLILITVATSKYSKSRVYPYYGRVVTIIHGLMFSTTLLGYSYFIIGFIFNVIEGSQYKAFVTLLGIVSTIITGVILQAYLMHITDNPKRRLAYPILYSVTILGLPFILIILMGLHFGEKFWSSYDKAKNRKEID